MDPHQAIDSGAYNSSVAAASSEMGRKPAGPRLSAVRIQAASPCPARTIRSPYPSKGFSGASAAAGRSPERDAGVADNAADPVPADPPSDAERAGAAKMAARIKDAVRRVGFTYGFGAPGRAGPQQYTNPFRRGSTFRLPGQYRRGLPGG